MKKESMTRALFFFIIVTFLTFFGSPFAKGTAKAETFRLTIGAAHPPVVIWVQRLRDFFCVEVEKRVKEKTGHEIKWVQAFGGTLAKMGEELEAVEGGVLDVSLIGLPFEPSKLYLHCFSYFVPFGIADLEQMTEVGFKVYDEVPWLKQVFEQKFNQKCLAPFASSGNVVIGSFPWQKIEDLKGKKIAGAGPNLLWFHPLGAVPTQINYGEAYSAGKSGVIDGGLATPGTTMAFKLYEVSDYYVECGFGAVLASVLTMNLNKWQKLPEAVRKILSEVSREYSFDQARAAKTQDERAVAFIRGKGMKIYPLPHEERVKWAGRLPDIPNETAMKANQMGMPGTEVMKAYIAQQEKAGHQFPRRWVIK